MQAIESKKKLAAWLTAFFFVAMGAKLWTIQLWTTNVLFWDQWDELTLFFKAWLDGSLTFYHFFVPHNEHRISVHKKLAAAYYRAGHTARAELHLREALWLQPDNLEVQRELVILKANGISEILPEKIDGFRFDTPASQSKH